MTASASTSFPPTTRAGGDYVVFLDRTVAVSELPEDGHGPALDALLAQEVRGERRERVPERVAALLDGFGFGWEPLSEPGHMRAVGDAAYLLARCQERAADAAASAFRDLDIPWIGVDGVSLVDTKAPVVASYMTLTSGVPGLYGDAPYAVTGEHDGYVLRQTSCFQKFSVCRERRLARRALPVALFEISDSYRREPADELQLCYRLRRFHLPEAHVHTAGVGPAVETTIQLHRHVIGILADLGVEVALLVTASHAFVTEHPDYTGQLVAAAGVPALLRIGPAGSQCQDGVEVDVEYKVLDSTGVCRELSTFQIDRDITRQFGVRCDDGSHPATIHTVLTGGVERYLYTVLDRVAQAEAQGTPRPLPLWLTPLHVRVLPADTRSLGAALATADHLLRAGLRVEVDDRFPDADQAVADATASLVPALLRVGTAAGGRPSTEVRRLGTAAFRDVDVPELVGSLTAGAPDLGHAPRLSRRPFTTDAPPARRQQWPTAT
ncbi:aminoacyl--tRNA ligase-related protein [Streptomyces sp. 900105755]